MHTLTLPPGPSSGPDPPDLALTHERTSLTPLTWPLLTSALTTLGVRG